MYNFYFLFCNSWSEHEVAHVINLPSVLSGISFHLNGAANERGIVEVCVQNMPGLDAVF